jgi:hypothetical protein
MENTEDLYSLVPEGMDCFDLTLQAKARCQGEGPNMHKYAPCIPDISCLKPSKFLALNAFSPFLILLQLQLTIDTFSAFNHV